MTDNREELQINDLVPDYVVLPDIKATSKLSPTSFERLSATRIALLLNYRPFVDELVSLYPFDEPEALLVRWNVLITIALHDAKRSGVFKRSSENFSVRLIDRKYSPVSEVLKPESTQGAYFMQIPENASLQAIHETVEKIHLARTYQMCWEPPEPPAKEEIEPGQEGKWMLNEPYRLRCFEEAAVNPTYDSRASVGLHFRLDAEHLERAMLVIRHCMTSESKLTPEGLTKAIVPAARVLEDHTPRKIRNMLSTIEQILSPSFH